MDEMDSATAAAAERLLDDDTLDERTGQLVLAGLTDELEDVLEGDTPSPPPASIPDPPPPTRAYLGAVTARSFRGIGPSTTLPLEPGPGLTLVVGRNGSGKSSFAEAAELALTGTSSRWEAKKSKVWQEGWANLHGEEPPLIDVQLAIDGEPGRSTLAVRWSDATDLDSARWEVRKDGETADRVSLGWDEAVSLYRPILSYNDLGALLEDGPSKLYDALAAILGLEAVTDAINRLAEARKTAEKAAKGTKLQVKQLAGELDEVEDDRAREVAGCLGRSTWDLDRAEELAIADHAERSEVEVLGRLAQMQGPDPAKAGELAAAVRTAIKGVELLRGTDADRADRTADLLAMAASLHDDHGDQQCPVCDAGTLDTDRTAEIRAEAERLRGEAGAARAARRALDQAIDDARGLLAPTPTVLADAAGTGVAIDLVPVRDAWESWLGAPGADDPASLADHIETKASIVADATAVAAQAARVRRDQMDDAWRPWAMRIAALIPHAREVQDSALLIKQLKNAEGWLQATADELRDARFAPIADEVKQTWELLRQGSSVEIGDVVLAGSKTRRRVDVEVTIDDVEGVALGVMSQGELHALALSLFIPRATLPQSPFGFLLIDDPVQAMDPARVDGLAQLLAHLGEERQVVVFTHDDRLPEAVRRLELDARVVEVRRRSGSRVETVVATHPAITYVEDALSVVRAKTLPPQLKARVVPGVCRHAVEAVAIDLARRQLLAAGTSHAEVEAQLGANHTVMQQLALGLFGDAERTADVYSTLRNKVGPWAVDTLKACNAGSHGENVDDLEDLVRSTRELVKKLEGS